MKRKAMIMLNGESLKDVFKLDYVTTYTVILFLSIYSLFPQISDFLGISRDTLIMIALAIFLVASVRNSYLLGKVEKKIKAVEIEGELKIDRLYQAIMNEFVQRKYRFIQIIRIFAFSTKVIQPIIEEACQASNISIRNCKLLLHYPDTDDEAAIMQELLRKWETVCGSKDNVKHSSFSGKLSDYCIIVDDKCAIMGSYTFDSNEKYGIKYSNTNVIVVDDQTKQGRSVISGLIDRFDTSFDYWEKMPCCMIKKKGEEENAVLQGTGPSN